MDKNHSEIRQVGPMFIIEGNIFKHPYKSRPLKGFEEHSFNNSDEFLNSIRNHSIEWFKRFPECCDAHKKLKDHANFKKSDYDYIPEQIVNNVIYFAYSIGTFINDENWLDEIKGYYDYLMDSLGSPNLGGHIFEEHVKHFIEHGSNDTWRLSDEQRIELLYHLEPQKKPVDVDDRSLDILYLTFQKWLEAMPNIGKFVEFKETFKGKLPMNIFFDNPIHNKYTGTTSFSPKSKKELLEFLIKTTTDILKLSNDEVKKYNKEKLLLTAEEKLKIQNKKLLEEHNEQEISYINLIESWLNISIDYYKVVNNVITNITAESINNNVNSVLSSVNDIKNEIIDLYTSDRLSNWVNEYLSGAPYNQITETIDNLDKEEGEEIFNRIHRDLQLNAKEEMQNIEYKINSPEVSVKHKIKISIPLFLFTKYETELEFSDKQKIPKNFKELKKYLFSN